MRQQACARSINFDPAGLGQWRKRARQHEADGLSWPRRKASYFFRFEVSLQALEPLAAAQGTRVCTA